MLTTEEWERITVAFAAPFPAEAVEFRFAKPGKIAAGQEGDVLASVDARAVQDMLDRVVGPACWSFTWEAISADAKGLYVAKGRLTIHGIVKEDVGDASALEGN